MKLFHSSLVSACLFSTAAFAETWSGSEGVCNEWRTQWHMSKHGDSYSGLMHGDQLKAACTAGGAIIDGQVTAIISGNTFSAHRVTGPDNNTCNFSGTITGDQINGTYTCSNGGPFNFSLSR
jgi:hypothetical protein